MTQLNQAFRQTGVTLMELAIVIAVVGVLAVAAMPSIVDRWQRETVVMLAERVASAVSLARATAQIQHVQVHLGPEDPARGLASGLRLTTSPPTSTPDRTSAQEGASLLSIPLPTLPTVNISSNLRGDTLFYAPVGYSRDAIGGQQSGTLTISSGRHIRRVRISPVGRARICDPDVDRRNCGPTSNDP